MALVSFLSGGYNLHRFSDAIGLVFYNFCSMARWCYLKILKWWWALKFGIWICLSTSISKTFIVSKHELYSYKTSFKAIKAVIGYPVT